MIDGHRTHNTKDASVRTHIGDDLRALRKARNMTISILAQKLGRSVGWLSQVERGQTDPGIPDIRALAAVFEIPVSFLFRNEMAAQNERGYVVRKDERVSYGNRQHGLTEELLSPDLSGDFEIIRSTFEPHSKSEYLAARPTQEAGYLVSGTLTLIFKDRQFLLQAGDSFQFQNEGFRWENDGDVPALVIWVISPPVY